MKQFFAILAAISLFVATAISSCVSGTAKEVEGNWYCEAVDGIRYTNVGHSGKYRDINAMNPDGSCSSSWKTFDGPLSPLHEEVSLHFRGPLHLKKLAVYTPSSSAETKRDLSTARAHRHVHSQFHELKKVKKVLSKREKEPDMVVATIYGKVVSWENNYFGPSATQTPNAPAPSPVMVTATIDGKVVSWVNNWYPDAAVATPATSPPEVPGVGAPTEKANPVPAPAAIPEPQIDPGRKSSVEPTLADPPIGGPGTFERIGFYDAASQTVDNLVFLGNYGGQGSGIFDYSFGASLAYANSDATGGSPTPQVLSDKVIPSNNEVIVMTGKECDGDCGFVRPGSVAYHGFEGPDKMFIMEFQMPTDGTSGFNADIPAIWILNAKIPRTLQYGNAECSCWESGCGEFDIAEALSSGSPFLKSTLHANQVGGDSDYLERPINGTMKLAVVFSSSASAIHIQKLPQDFEFLPTLEPSEIDKFCEYGRGQTHDSLFPVQ